MKKLFIIILLLFINYSGISQMVTSCNSTSTSCSCYTITPSSQNQTGGVFSPSTIDLSQPFNFTFTVYLGDDNNGADGIAFVLQPNNTIPGPCWQSAGGDMGFANITTSIAIEIDTYENAGLSDIASDHVTFVQNGDQANPLTTATNIGSDIEDGTNHIVNIQWNPVTQVLSIYIDGSFIDSYTGDIINNIFGGNPNVYFGFTGATGGLYNLQTVCMYRNASFTPNKTTVCIGEAVNFTDNSTSDLGQITYLWDFGDGTTSTLQSPSHAWATSGTKTVTLTISDPSGCTDVATVNITVSPEITANFFVSNVSCYGGNDGAITTTPTNGSAPYTYNWDIPSTDQNPTGLLAGTYNLTITDNNGCTGNSSVTVSQPQVLTITSITTTDASCGNNDGTITINAAGGTINNFFGTYQYSVQGQGTQSNNVFTNLAVGSYNVSVQDDNGCTATSNGVVVNQATLMAITNVTTADEFCGSNNGSITVDIQNGIAPYTYTLNTGATNTTSATSNTFNNLGQGTYSVTVTDANSCVVFQNNIIINNYTYFLSIDGFIIDNHVSCNGGNDGQVTILVSGGTPNYTYSLDGGVTTQSSNVFSNLSAGMYTITVTDANNCSATILSGPVITEPTPLIIDNVTVDNQVSCNGGNDGQVTITASGGNGNYTYSLDGGVTTQSSNVFTNLSAGNYTVTLFEGPNCFTSVNGDFTITEPQPIVINSIVSTDVTCNGANDGAIDVTSVSGGTPAYQYSLDGVTYQTQTIFSNLGFGSYTVYVTDNNSCPPVTQNVSINEAAPLSVSIGNSDTTVCLGAQGNICANVTGGTPPYNYIWNGIQTPSSCVPIPSNASGTVQITIDITDANNCSTTNTVTKNIIVLSALSVNVISNPTNGIVCPGETVNLIAEATGGNNGPYTYTWTNNVDATTLVGANQTISPTGLTNYTVTVSDGCTSPNATANLQVDIYPTPNPVFSAVPNSGCTPLISEFSHTIPSSDIAYQEWTFSNGQNSNQTTTTQTFIDEGCTDVNYTMTTNDGCIIDTTLIDFVCVYPYPIADFEYSPDSVNIMDTEVTFTNLTTNGDNYLWTLGTGDSTTAINPIYTYPEYGFRDYEVWLFASNIYGCVDSISKIIHVYELPWFYIPNTFTPEGNNLNELFKPIFIPGFTPNNYTFTIFDRWGEVIFQTNDIYSYWDGVYKGVLVPTGTYVWKIRFTENETDKSYVEFGHVNVIR